jgi:hypothetical protein
VQVQTDGGAVLERCGYQGLDLAGYSDADRVREDHLAAFERASEGAGGERAVQALAVEHEGRVDSAALRQLREDLLGVCHLRHAGGTDEAGGFDAGEAGAREPHAQLRAGLRRERHLVALEPVARTHVADADLQGVDSSAHPVTGVIPPGMLD